MITTVSPLGHNNRILIVWDFIIHLCCLAAFSWGFYRSHWCFWPWTGCDWTHTRTHPNWFDHAVCLLLRPTSCVFWLGSSFIWLDVYPRVDHVINPPVLLISRLPSALMRSLGDLLFVWTQSSELPYSSVGTTIRDLLKGERQSTCLPTISSVVHDLQSTSLLPPTGAWEKGHYDISPLCVDPSATAVYLLWAHVFHLLTMSLNQKSHLVPQTSGHPVLLKRSGTQLIDLEAIISSGFGLWYCAITSKLAFISTFWF